MICVINLVALILIIVKELLSTLWLYSNQNQSKLIFGVLD